MLIRTRPMKQEYIHPLADAVPFEGIKQLCISNESIQPGDEIDWAPGSNEDDYE